MCVLRVAHDTYSVPGTVPGTVNLHHDTSKFLTQKFGSGGVSIIFFDSIYGPHVTQPIDSIVIHF